MDITKRLEIKSNMIFLGEKIAFGSECALMDEAIIEIQTLRAKVASAELLVEALQTIRLANSDYTVKNAKATMQSIDKLVKEALATYDKQSEVKHDTK